MRISLPKALKKLELVIALTNHEASESKQAISDSLLLNKSVDLSLPIAFRKLAQSYTLYLYSKYMFYDALYTRSYLYL